MAKKNNTENVEVNSENSDIFSEESIDLDIFSNEKTDIIDIKLEENLETTKDKEEEVVDIRRVPSKKGVNSKHTIKSGTDTSSGKKQVVIDSLKETPIKQSNNLIKTNITTTIKSKKDQYVPNLVGKKYKIYSNGKMIYDSTVGGNIVFNPDWLEIGTSKWFYDKINFVL
jgi:hypothetical protein